MGPEVEQAFVATFVDPRFRTRWRESLQSPKHRRKLLQRLWNAQGDWRTELVTPLRLSGDRSAQIEAMVREFAKHGGGDLVKALSASEGDGEVMTVRDALEQFADDGGAVLISPAAAVALHLPETGPPLLLISNAIK